MIFDEQQSNEEHRASTLFLVFYATTRRLPQEVVDWSQSPEGKKALEDWEADYRATLARWAEEDAEAERVNAERAAERANAERANA